MKRLRTLAGVLGALMLRASGSSASDTAEHPGGNPRQTSYEEAFVDLYETLGHEYPCFKLKGIDWKAVGEELLPRVRDVATDDEFGRYDATRHFYRRMEEGAMTTLEMREPDGHGRTCPSCRTPGTWPPGAIRCWRRRGSTSSKRRAADRRRARARWPWQARASCGGAGFPSWSLGTRVRGFTRVTRSRLARYLGYRSPWPPVPTCLR